MKKDASHHLEAFLFGSRWLQAPLYLGLVFAQGVYVFKFLQELVHLVGHAVTLTEIDIMLIVLGLIAFAAGTAGGVLFGQIMRIASGNKINPLIGSAGVSAVPMAARVSQIVGLKDNPSNYLLMQAMGPNVAGVIGTAVAAGTMLAQFGG